MEAYCSTKARKTGVIFPTDTYNGFRALGFNTFIALQSALAFHILHVSFPTCESWIPDLRFPVYVERIARAKHGSDTESYTMEGTFDEGRYDRIFKKFDEDQKGGLYFSEIVTMWKANRNVLDLIGWTFQVFLWGYLWLLAADPQTGILDERSVRKQYDGSLYYELEKRQKSGNRLPFVRGGELW
ncbi:EF-hand domain pair [Phaffia rhodozyma]|uniref:EF-hand domain pair n=1 Tax=Phaffia rhodozyma TaxID=264483 RepID=A0A0F7SE58_PHARH|nr:EF-hand domain pair [Phaffia rhodozyma]